MNFEKYDPKVTDQINKTGGLLGGQLTCGDIALDTISRMAMVREQPLAIARREVDVLEVLMRRSGKVVPRPAIEAAIYTIDEAPGPNALEASVSRLRRSLAEAGASVVLHTVRGVGYLLTEAPR